MTRQTKRGFIPGRSQVLQVGEQAPPFELRRTFEENISLDDLVSKGPALVAFYVFDFGNI